MSPITLKISKLAAKGKKLVQKMFGGTVTGNTSCGHLRCEETSASTDSSIEELTQTTIKEWTQVSIMHWAEKTYTQWMADATAAARQAAATGNDNPANTKKQELQLELKNLENCRIVSSHAFLAPCADIQAKASTVLEPSDHSDKVLRLVRHYYEAVNAFEGPVLKTYFGTGRFPAVKKNKPQEPRNIGLNPRKP